MALLNFSHNLIQSGSRVNSILEGGWVTCLPAPAYRQVGAGKGRQGPEGKDYRTITPIRNGRNICAIEKAFKAH